ncbi:unnamed protein product, partial [Gulo gulo]
ALSFQHHKLGLRREDSWPSSSSSNWLESALTPQECITVWEERRKDGEAEQ